MRYRNICVYFLRICRSEQVGKLYFGYTVTVYGKVLVLKIKCVIDFYRNVKP